MKVSPLIREALNRRQLEAVSCTVGPLLVLAGAGTGKTRVITYRIANMVDNGIPPENIAGMTFTNKAAEEMRMRLRSLGLRQDVSKVFLGTFHSFCSRLLRKEIKVLGFTPNFTIADETDQLAVVNQAAADCDIHKDAVNAPLFLALISRAKNNFQSPVALRKNSDNEFENALSFVFERYNQILELQNVLDFDDLLLFAVRILQDFPDVLMKYQDKYKYILVDEYQDTNKVQFKLVKLLAGKAMNVCVVGDDDQSIYGWRGAEIRNILEFPDHYPGCRTVVLDQNYRSTNMILNAANSIISRIPCRHGKHLWSEEGEGESIKVINAASAEDEASYIAASIAEAMFKGGGVSYNDFAVLYRSNHQSRSVEDALRSREIPYRLIGGRSFYERREIRDAVAYLKLIVNPNDDQSFLRIIGVPPRGIGDKAIGDLKRLRGETQVPMSALIGDERFVSKLASKAAESARGLASAFARWKEPFSEPGNIYRKLEGYLRDCGYLDGLLKIYRDRQEAQSRFENVMELLNLASRTEMSSGVSLSLTDFLEKFSLLDDSDKVQEDSGGAKDAVNLMTVHSAKGLEFAHVYISGMEQNVFPHERSMKDSDDSDEEERRLFYVAITRARRTITMTWAAERMRYGKTSKQSPSKFLEDLPPEMKVEMGASKALTPMTAEDMKNAMAAYFKSNSN